MIGDTVTVRGEEYRIVDEKSTSHLGTKFYGKISFTLEKASDGTRWTAYGKKVAHNSTLVPKK
ncbi:hypothetical protein [Nocardia wallacei]|uniref:hypothetical protein n=1 Tax=Nocardia wallacei TaxID=480035 RepID=UPI0024559A32|nr:hypothetical protein [Nocardia wallacei]